MCYLFNSARMAKMNQVGRGRLFTALFISMVVTGCTNNAVNRVPTHQAAVAKKPPAKVQQQVVVINKPRKTVRSMAKAKTRPHTRSRANHARPAKDQHHVARDKKRMWYNQQWLVKQEAEERQRVQRLHYQQKYEEKLQQQAQEKQQQAEMAKRQQAQARWEQEQQRQRQQSLLASVQLASANVGRRSNVNQHQQRQAQIEARQQQYNWRQDGGNWEQAQARTQAQARQKVFQQQQVRQQHQQRWQQQQRVQQQQRFHQQQRFQQQRVARARHSTSLAGQLSNAAIARTYHKIHYDGRYIPISYPMGDVPAHIGVCTDTLIRSYRRLGIDLQQLVHEDISRAFHAYPNLPKWGLSAPDTNIDHRRVHNLKVFFTRNGQRLPVTNNPEHYRPGDIVTWHLGGDQEHIGLVVDRRSPEDPRRHMIVHNIAKGDRMEDILFKLPITGHYRYLPNRSRWLATR